MATSFGTRKALGRRYGVDPALLLESERLAQEYALVPGREARALQSYQFGQGLDVQREAIKQAGVSGMVGTFGNLATTAGVLRAITLPKGEPFFGKLFGGGSSVPPAMATTPGMAMTPGMATVPAAGISQIGGSAPVFSSGMTHVVNPVLMDTAGMGAAGEGAGVMTGAATTGATGAAAPATGLGMGAAAGAGAVGGYVGGQLGQPIGEAIGLGGRAERGAVGGAVVGAGAAMAYGAAVGSAAGPVGIAVGAVVGGIVGFVTCFLKGTPVDMQDGSVRLIETIDLFDDMKEGGRVNGIGKMISDNIYDYHGVFVSGSHAVLEQGTWKRIEDSDEAIEIPIDDMVVVYAVNNQHHRIISKGITFADYGEVTDSEDMTPEERIVYLNGHQDFEIRGTSLSVPC